MIVVQETEYTGAGKHIQPQLSFARENGIDIFFGDPSDEVAGKNIILPSHPSLIKAVDIDLDKMRISLIKNALANYNVKANEVCESDIKFLAKEIKADEKFVKDVLGTL
jgi:hypothetical protein